MMILKKNNEKEINEIVKINELVNISWYKEDIITLLEQDNYLLLYDDYGYIFISYLFDEAEILNIAVHPQLFGKGLAQNLWEQVVLFFYDKQIKKCYLEVRESNSRARKFYEKNNFKVISNRKNYYKNPKEDAIIYEWIR